MLRCASSFVVAAYDKVRLTPQDSRALPAELFTKPARKQGFYDFLPVRQRCSASPLLGRLKKSDERIDQARNRVALLEDVHGKARLPRRGFRHRTDAGDPDLD